MRPPPISTLFPYTTLFRSFGREKGDDLGRNRCALEAAVWSAHRPDAGDEGLNGQIVTLQQPVLEVEAAPPPGRSEEHTSELQSHHDLVCRLLLEKKNDLLQ